MDTKGQAAKDYSLLLEKVGNAPPPAPGVEFCNLDPGSEIWDYRTDGAGSFDLQNVAPGKYFVVLLKISPMEDFAYRQIPVKGVFLDLESGDFLKDFEILINPPEDYAISGHVRDSKGRPLARQYISIYDSGTMDCWTRSANDGAFRIEGLDGTGKSSFNIVFSDDMNLSIPDVPLNTKNLELVLPGYGNLNGTVWNEKTGEQVKIYKVTVPVVHLQNSKAIWKDPRVKIMSNPDASFTLSDIPTGYATIEIQAEGLGTQRFTVFVDEGKTSQVKCGMLGPTVLKGRTMLNGKPTRMYVVLKDKWLYSDDGGNYQFDKHPNGDYNVWFFKDEFWLRSAEVQLKSGETKNLDKEMGGSCEVHGKVTFPKGEEEYFCTVRIAAKPAPNGWQESGRPKPEEFVLAYDYIKWSDEREFSLKNIPAGKWFFMAQIYDAYTYQSQIVISKEIELKDGESLSSDLDLRQK